MSAIYPCMSDIRRNSHIDGIPEPTGPFNWTAEWNGLVFVSGVRGIDPLTGQPAKVTALNQNDSIEITVIAAKTAAARDDSSRGRSAK
jgi:hypothetical protein